MSKTKSQSTSTAKKTPAKKKATTKKVVKKAVPKKPVAKKSVAKKRIGRPSAYNEKIAAKICSYLAVGESMRTVCKRPGMPAMSTVFLWLREHPDFSEQYARAKEEAADVLIEDILDIADEAGGDFIERRNKEGVIIGFTVDKEAIQRSRLKIDTRKWLASKLKPKKYGERLSVDSKNEHTGIVEHQHAYQEMSDEELKSIAAQYVKDDK